MEQRVRIKADVSVIGRAWNKYNSLGSMSIFKTFMRPNHDTGRSVLLSVRRLSFVSSGLKFRAYTSGI